MRAGSDHGLVLSLDLELRPGGELTFLAPALSLQLEDDELTVELYPLGTDEKDDLSLRLTPDPLLTSTPEGTLALVEGWDCRFPPACCSGSSRTSWTRRSGRAARPRARSWRTLACCSPGAILLRSHRSSPAHRSSRCWRCAR